MARQALGHDQFEGAALFFADEGIKREQQGHEAEQDADDKDPVDGLGFQQLAGLRCPDVYDVPIDEYKGRIEFGAIDGAFPTLCPEAFGQGIVRTRGTEHERAGFFIDVVLPSIENQLPQAPLGIVAPDFLLGLDLLEIVVASELVRATDKAEGVEYH